MSARLSPARWIAMALAVALVLMAAIVALTIPSRDPTSRIAGIQQSSAGATVVIRIKIDAVNAAAGTFTARIQVVPGHADVFPVDGAVVYTDIGGLPPIKVYSDVLPATYSVVIDATAGEVSSYPFDRYATTVGFQVAAGTERTLKEAFVQPTLPFAIIGESSASGFDVEGTTAASAVGTGEVTFHARRSASTKSWAIAMMVINWLIALAAMGVALAVVLRQRMWETRHLAWLGSLIFALSAFRNTAPGNPPIGTFLDYRSFFPAIALVVASLIALVVTFLVQPRDQLGL